MLKLPQFVVKLFPSYSLLTNSTNRYNVPYKAQTDSNTPIQTRKHQYSSTHMTGKFTLDSALGFAPRSRSIFAIST